MILIRKIDWIEVDRDPVEIISMEMPHTFIPCSGSEEYIEVNELHELVHGRRFIRPRDGTDITVGIADEAAIVLGLQYEAWRNMENELKSTSRELINANSECVRVGKKNLNLELKLAEFESSGFWKNLERLLLTNIW